MSPRHRNPRRGTIVLLVAISLLTILACTALVIDRAWLRLARGEIEAATEASALAAARALVTDGTLKAAPNWPAITARAEAAAARVARENRVAGTPVELRTGPDGDLRFGRRVLNAETGAERLVFTDVAPTTVVVTAERTRRRSNPVATLLADAFGVPYGDVGGRGEATIDNHVLGVRTLAEIPIPALPIAIRASNEADERNDGWTENIDGPAGCDELRWDAESGTVVREPDGLPELTLRTLSSQDGRVAPNVQLVDFGNGFRTDRLNQQIARGLADGDLAEWNGELRLDGRRVPAPCSAPFTADVVRAFRDVIGQPRLCFLYENHRWEGDRGDGRLDLVRLVAVRVLDVRFADFDSAELVVQPAVVATKTAIPLEDRPWRDDADRYRNPHVFTIQLVR